jgi:hypothetical protein
MAWDDVARRFHLKHFPSNPGQLPADCPIGSCRLVCYLVPMVKLIFAQLRNRNAPGHVTQSCGLLIFQRAKS